MTDNLKRNYDHEMQDIIAKNVNKGVKPKLLMHSCCAPCSTACIERVKEFFELTVYYFNPNIDGVDEFNRRSDEQVRLCNELGVDCVVVPFDKSEFLGVVRDLEKAAEGGARCKECFNLRLTKTATAAKELGYDYFTTTLTVSPLKNASVINQTGERIAKEIGVNYLPSDFKKRNGYLRSVELSKKFGLYRQNYCGCEFSKNKDNE